MVGKESAKLLTQFYIKLRLNMELRPGRERLKLNMFAKFFL